ncbi:MAG: hypothetical protein LBP92_05055 [Deltaproteobacteria bacterium]|nr:hypothetical protein [Deltaproteobacteria bacterium]
MTGPPSLRRARLGPLPAVPGPDDVAPLAEPSGRDQLASLNSMIQMPSDMAQTFLGHAASGAVAALAGGWLPPDRSDRAIHGVPGELRL